MIGLAGITPDGKTRYTFSGLRNKDILNYLNKNYRQQD
jgi:hypothetical protein